MLTLNSEFKDQIVHITKLSKKANKNPVQKIFNMIEKHIKEIQELYTQNNDHWAIETADLIILCYELLILGNINIDSTFTKAVTRFDKKLNKIIEEKKNL